MFSHVFISSIPWNSVIVQILLDISVQGPRSNFEIGEGGGEGGGHISDSILGGHNTLFVANSLKL